MAATLALSDSTVTTPTGQRIEHAHVMARDGVLRVRADTVPDIQAFGVESVERVSRDSWTVSTVDGVYMIDAKGCGCS